MLGYTASIGEAWFECGVSRSSFLLAGYSGILWGTFGVTASNSVFRQFGERDLGGDL
jgi:hypothetical protein